MSRIPFSFICGCALSQAGCVVESEGGRSLAISVAPGEIAPSATSLEIWPPRHDEPRIVHGREYACLSTYDIVNPNDEVEGVATLVISAQPAFAFETVTAQWTDDESTVHRVAAPDQSGLVVLSYPDAGVQIKPRSSRTLRLCGVTKKVVGAGQGNGIEPESGSAITATLLVVEELDGRHSRFIGKDDRPHHVLRASEPSITLAPSISHDELRIGASTLLEWNLVAHRSGQIAIKQFAFNLDLADATLCNFRLLDDSDEGPPEHKIVELTKDLTGSRNLQTACLDHPASVVVTFTDEYLFGPRSGAVFTFQADISVLGEKPALHASFRRSKDVITDTLACDNRGFAFFLSDTAIVPGLIWSDVAAVPHSPVNCSTSRDWITDALVLDF